MVIVDTCIWLEIFRRNGDPGAKLAFSHLARNQAAALCGPVEMEILGGTQLAQQNKLRRNLGLYPRPHEPAELWHLTGLHFSQLRSKGVTAPWNDVLIATIALDSNSRIYTSDKHFQLMSPILGLSLYTPGPGGTFNPHSDSP